MGIVAGISHDKFPRQAEGFLGIGTRVKVCFNYDTSPDRVLDGVIVRNDTESPGLLIIKLSNDRYVLSTECMYSPE